MDGPSNNSLPDNNDMNVWNMMNMEDGEGTTQSVNIDNTQNMDLSNLKTISKLSKIIVNNKNLDEISEIELKLKGQIEKIQNEVTGVRASFQYLFNRDGQNQKSDQLKRMETFQEFISDVKAKIIQQTIQDREEAIRKYDGILPPTDLPPPMPLPKKLQRAPARPPGQPPEGHLPSLKTTESPELPLDSLSRKENNQEETSAGTTPTPPVTPTGIPTPPTLPGTPKGAPPPPPPGGTQKGLPLKAPVVKKFADEPTEPSKISGKIDGLTTDQLKEQISEIEEFVTNMKKALAPIQEAVKKETKLKEALDEAKLESKSIEKDLPKNEKKLAILQETGPSSNLKLEAETGKEITITFFSDERWQQMNAMLKKQGVAALSNKYLRSVELENTKKEIARLKSLQEETNTFIQTTEQELKNIEKSKSGNVISSEYSKILKIKTEKLEKWERALNTSKDKLKPSSKPSKPSQLTKAATISTLAQDAVLLEEFPELATLEQLLASKNAQILLKGEGYHDKLSS